MAISGRVNLHKVIPDTIDFVLFGLEIFTVYSRTVFSKRYTDFFRFHSLLCSFVHFTHKGKQLVNSIPKFPPQHLFSRTTDDRTIEKRKKELNNYLKGVLEIFNNSQKEDPWVPVISEFLCVKEIKQREQESALKIQQTFADWKKEKARKEKRALEFQKKGWVVNLEEIPDELVLNVLGYLSLDQLCRISRVNKRWNGLSKKPILWTTLNLFEGGYSMSPQHFEKICIRSWQLVNLDLRFCNEINKYTLHAIAMNCNPLALKELYLDGCENVDDDALKSLVSKYPNRKPESLKRLEENDNFAPFMDFEMDEDLKGGARGLRVISIAECRRVTENGIIHLRKLKRLKSLNVLGCYAVNDEGIATLVLCSNNFKELNLSGTSITRTSLLTVKTYCPKLKSITLNGCRLLSNEDAEIFTDIDYELNEDTFRFQLFPSDNTSLPSLTTNILRTRGSLAIQRVAQFVNKKLERELEVDVLHKGEVVSPYLTLSDLPTDENGLLTLKFQLRSETLQLEEAERKNNWTIKVPVWVEDCDANSCMRCGSDFGILRWKHHCRYCGKVVCGDCSKEKRFIPCLGFTKEKVRVCFICAAVIKNNKESS